MERCSFTCDNLPSNLSQSDSQRCGSQIFGPALFSSALEFHKRYVPQASPQEILKTLCQVSQTTNSDSFYSLLINKLNPRVSIPALVKVLRTGYSDPFLSFLSKQWLVLVLLYESKLEDAVQLLQRCGVNFRKPRVSAEDLLKLISSLNDETVVCLAMNLVKTKPGLQDKLFQIGSKYISLFSFF